MRNYKIIKIEILHGKTAFGLKEKINTFLDEHSKYNGEKGHIEIQYQYGVVSQVESKIETDFVCSKEHLYSAMLIIKEFIE